MKKLFLALCGLSLAFAGCENAEKKASIHHEGAAAEHKEEKASEVKTNGAKPAEVKANDLRNGQKPAAPAARTLPSAPAAPAVPAAPAAK